MGRSTIGLPHKLEFTIWWDETNCPRRVEFIQPNALVKSAIIEFHGIPDTLFALVYNQFVVQAELTFWYTREIRSHEDVSVYVSPQNIACANVWKCTKGVATGNTPFALILRFTVSTTSTKASFFLYLTSVRRQLMAPVAWVVIFEDSSCGKVSKRCHSFTVETNRSRWGGYDAFRHDEGLQSVNFAVLWVPKVDDLCWKLGKCVFEEIAGERINAPSMSS